MGSPVVTSTTTVVCGHGGSATHVPAQPRVLVGGSPVGVSSDQHVVAGCALSASSGPFCTVLTWTVPAVRVTAGGMPLLVQTSTPMGVGPGMIVSGQVRVNAT